MVKKEIDKAIKEKVYTNHSDGVSRKRIAEKYGISSSSVSRIIKSKQTQHNQASISETKGNAERQKKIEDLERRIAQLEKKILQREARKRPSNNPERFD